MLSTAPSIVVEDASACLGTKKRRFECHDAEPRPRPRSSSPSGLKSEAEWHPIPNNNENCVEPAESTLVCFGMVPDRVVVRHLDATLVQSRSPDAVIFTSSCELRCKRSQGLVGKLHDDDQQMLSTLAADGELALQLTFSTSLLSGVQDPKPPKETVGYLEIIIYGPKHRFDDVGFFFNQCGCYLEDPVGCDRNVPYMNPQCLFSLYEHPPMTFELSPYQQHRIQDYTQASFDILADFETPDFLQETATPTALRTSLKMHQRQALTFLLRRERGLHPAEDSVGIWSRMKREETEEITYVNIITKQVQTVPRPIWRGGLLADDMGLGKTLTLIALIASDCDGRVGFDLSSQYSSWGNELHSTLIIVPLNVLAVWESQLESHVHRGRLTWFTHLGKNKLQLSEASSARLPDIVFTTYQTVEREKRTKTLSKSSLFSYNWKRLILDEAHIARNYKTATTLAISCLKATSRWAISGTPVQNSLTDFLGLFKCLHFSPYDDPTAFDNDLSNLWRTRPAEEAAETFKKLLSCIMLRRTKSILELSEREDKVIWLKFNDQEEEYYRRIERPVVEMLEETGRETQGTGNLWMSTMQQVNKLRLVCNLGIFTPSSQPDTTSFEGYEGSQNTNPRLYIGGEICCHCLQPMDSLPSEKCLGSSPPSTVHSSGCNALFCGSCSALLNYQTPQPCGCKGGSTACVLQPILSVSTTPRLSPSAGSSPLPLENGDFGGVSTKVQAVISQINAHLTEKHVVFSSWTSSLDMLERGLTNCGIKFVRIDGKISPTQRGRAINMLRNDPDVRVIVITIGCGACGLDLTVASRVHLLEPQWNPFIEEQALARIHRIGQTRPVSTFRYLMENSFEKQILMIQERKKQLSNTLLSNGPTLEDLRQSLREG